VAAGVLHDVIEDCGVTRHELETNFNKSIARWVAQVSEQPKKVDWFTRKKKYRENLAKADKEAVAIALADHLHNMQCLINQIKIGEFKKAGFHASLKDKIENEKLILEIFKLRLSGKLLLECKRTFQELCSVENLKTKKL